MSEPTMADKPPQASISSEPETEAAAAASDTAQVEEPEHPDARKIRGQVEYYFSDTNLRTDLHLLQCCSGRDNVPVSISRICGWRKMRQWKKKDVVAALRKSKFLDVVEDGKKIKRKKPLTGKCLLDPDFKKDDDDDEIAYDPRSKRAIHHPVQPLPQGKKELPPGVTKNMLKPTGFEDSYVEAPITPQEAEEEMEMYDPDKPFVERIEIAIQRFKQRRRMHEMYSKIFNKFMKFGGVDCEPRMFGALSQAEMKEMTAKEIARATATHHVPWDREERDKWVVDFVGVGEAFLSSFYPANYTQSPNQVKIACQVLRSFYNYLLFHDVCNEYRDDLLAARSLCDKAEFELPQSYAASNALPGAFNIAASTIFGGSYAIKYPEHGGKSWIDSLEEEEKANIAACGMRNDEAVVRFNTGYAVYAADTQYEPFTYARISSMKVIKTEDTGLEVTDIKLPTDEDRKAYQVQVEEWQGMNLQPLGKLICKPWFSNNFDEYDLPPDKMPGNEGSKGSNGKEYTFWVEEDALKECYVGLKLVGTVMTLSTGVQILDQVKETMCSFFKLLPNELWEAHKPPRFRLQNRHLQNLPGAEEDEGEKREGENGEKDMEAGEMSDDMDE